MLPSYVLRILDPRAPRSFAVSAPGELGRSPDCRYLVEHPSVSRRHAALTPLPDGIEVEVLSSRSGTFFDGALLPAGQRRLLRVGQSFQVGAVVMQLENLETTLPVLEPTDPPPTSLIRVHRGAEYDSIYVAGRLLDAPSAVLRLLTVLALRPSELVSTDELNFEVGEGANLHQVVSLARRALREAMEAGEVSLDDWTGALREAAAGHRVSIADVSDAAALMRRVLLSRRGAGYVLCLPPGTVQVDIAP